MYILPIGFYLLVYLLRFSDTFQNMNLNFPQKRVPYRLFKKLQIRIEGLLVEIYLVLKVTLNVHITLRPAYVVRNGSTRRRNLIFDNTETAAVRRCSFRYKPDLDPPARRWSRIELQWVSAHVIGLRDLQSRVST